MALMQINDVAAQTMSAENRQAAENLALLLQMLLFQGVPEAAVRALAGVMTQDEFKAGRTIFSDGDFGYMVYFVCSGEVEISLTNREKAKLFLESEKAGDFFGEVAALQGNMRTATALALQTTQVLMVTGENLKAVLREYPDILLAMYAQTARRLGRTSVDLRRTRTIDAAQLFQEQMSDRERQVRAFAQFCGSLKMLRVNAAFVTVWLGAVYLLGGKPFDGVWFNALALALTVEAIFITCIVLHSQNLQEARERFIKQKETEANIRTDAVVTNLDEKLNNLRAELLLRLPEPTNAVVATRLRSDEEHTP